MFAFLPDAEILLACAGVVIVGMAALVIMVWQAQPDPNDADETAEEWNKLTDAEREYLKRFFK